MRDDLVEFSKLMTDMKEAIRTLEVAVYHFNHASCHALEKAKIARDEVVSAMNQLRAVVDNAESKVDAKDWPIPSYIDLLFGI